jgi:hypothetical protein
VVGKHDHALPLIWTTGEWNWLGFWKSDEDLIFLVADWAT